MTRVHAHTRGHAGSRGAPRRPDPAPPTGREGAAPNSAPPGALLLTPTDAAISLAVPESWLRRKAGRRVIPCTFIGKHLRFSASDLAAIVESGAQQARPQPATLRR